MRVVDVKKLFNVCIGALICTVTVGCAQLSPQQIDFKPSISTANLTKGAGTTSLMVVDQRADKVIGYRGGVYEDTSTIVAMRPLDKVIEALAIKVLEQKGIEISTAFPEMSLTINIDKLSYVTEDLKASLKRTTALAAVSVEVRKGNKTFTNGFSSSQYIETVGYPSKEKNEVLLNEVFEAVLQRMFTDAKLNSFLSQ